MQLFFCTFSGGLHACWRGQMASSRCLLLLRLRYMSMEVYKVTRYLLFRDPCSYIFHPLLLTLWSKHCDDHFSALSASTTLHLSENDRKFPRFKRRRLFMYAGPAVSGRRNRSGEGETAENIWCSSFLPFPLSATSYSVWLEKCSD